MRTFVAAPISQEVLAAARDLQQFLQRGGHRLRYVAPENLHFTLKFLGEISPEEAQRAGSALHIVRDEFSPFQVSVGSLGGFPNLRTPRVLWIGVDAGAEEMERLARRVDEICAKVGLEGDTKPFRSHLTIARSRERRPKSFSIPKRALDIRLGEMMVDRVILFRSDLGPEGAKYTPLSEILLGGGRGSGY
jgi:2'-5' RNA ligase